MAKIPVLTVYDDNGNEIPIPAIKGKDGKDYVLTDADKEEIANLLAGVLTNEEWTFTLEDGSTVTKAVYVAPSTFRFTISQGWSTNADATYQAIRGMTWGEWLESEYNTAGFGVYDDWVVDGNPEGFCVCYTNDEGNDQPVLLTEAISAETIYYWG